MSNQNHSAWSRLSCAAPLLLAVILTACGSSGGNGSASSNAVNLDPAAMNWELVWSDEFTDAELDSSKWTFDLGNGFTINGDYISGWGNNELQYYTANADNISVIEPGQLQIQALVETTSDAGNVFDYSSARIKTQGLYMPRFGRVEARIKLPLGQGLWPAFWMMPQDNVYGTWAASGEIDIMEARGSNPAEVHGTIHYGSQWPNNTYTSNSYTFREGDINDYHVYRVDWLPGKIVWYVDDEIYATQTNWYTTDADFPAPFDQHFYLILNLAVGGHYDGDPQSDAIFPAQMLVDYVRVYDAPELAEYRQ